MMPETGEPYCTYQRHPLSSGQGRREGRRVCQSTKGMAADEDETDESQGEASSAKDWARACGYAAVCRVRKEPSDALLPDTAG